MIRRTIYLAFYLILLGSLTANIAFSQAWPQPKGNVYTKISYGQSTAINQINFAGTIRPYVEGIDSGEPFSDKSFYWYTEFGLTNNLTIMLSVPYKRVQVQDVAFRYKTEAIGTVTAGVRYGLKDLFHLDWPAGALATNLLVNIPTGYTRNLLPSVGSGQMDVQLNISTGFSLYPIPIYMQAGGGYQIRSSVYGFSSAKACNVGSDIDCINDTQPGYNNEFVFSAEIGTVLGDWALIHVLTNGIFSVDEPTAATSFTASNPIPTRQRFIKAGGGLTFYPLKKHFKSDLGLSVQYFITPYGRNTIDSQDLFIGVEYQLKFGK